MRLAIFALVLLSACTTINENKGKEQKKSATLSFEKEQVYDLGNGLLVKDFSIAPTTLDDNCEGLKVKMVVSPSSESLGALKKHQYSAFFINISVKVNKNEAFSFVKGARTNYNKNINFNKAPYIAAEGDHYYESIVPFYELSLPKGKVNADFFIEVLPVKLSSDSSLKKLRKLKLIGEKPLAEKKFEKSINAPDLYKNRISVNGFNLPGSTNKKFDFALTGKGLPELFWELRCGDKVIYSSEPIKNTLKYSIKTKTPYFTSTLKDKIFITIYDLDQGPFNSRDFIDEWSGTITELKKGNPEFKMVQNFKPAVESIKKN